MSEPDTSPDPRAERLIELMEDIGRRTRHIMPEQWPEVELTMPQMRTLMLLNSGPYRMSDIADQIGSSYSAATAMIDRLVEKDLVERVHSTTDRRVVLCQLTTSGRTALDEIWGIQRSGMFTLVGVMTDDELDMVLRGMEIMLEASSRLGPDSSSNN